MTEDSLPAGFVSFEDPSHFNVGTCNVLLEHWKKRVAQGLKPIVWLKVVPTPDKPGKHSRAAKGSSRSHREDPHPVATASSSKPKPKPRKVRMTCLDTILTTDLFPRSRRPQPLCLSQRNLQ